MPLLGNARHYTQNIGATGAQPQPRPVQTPQGNAGDANHVQSDDSPTDLEKLQQQNKTLQAQLEFYTQQEEAMRYFVTGDARKSKIARYCAQILSKAASIAYIDKWSNSVLLSKMQVKKYPQLYIKMPMRQYYVCIGEIRKQMSQEALLRFFAAHDRNMK